jgi:hypothetical protein
MDDSNHIPIIGSIFLPRCRYIIYWTIPFSMTLSIPFALIFSYYNTQNQQNFRKWKVRPFLKDIFLFWGCFSLYGVVRSILFDPYCDPHSIHYNKSLNAFERRKNAIEGMREVLKAEGKITTQNKAKNDTDKS